ncbi:unnamed protein product [Cunninghamella blakesleeana]
MDIDQIDSKVTTNGNTLGNENAWNLLDARKELYNAIENGEILKAIDLIEKRFPGLIQKDDHINTNTNINNNNNNNNDNNNNKQLENASRVLFKLKCQQFIEIVRTKPEEAVLYARQHLQTNRLDYKEMVDEVFVLIAYEDLSKSGQTHLLSQDHRRQLADEVNCVVLNYCDMSEYTSIERLQRQYEVLKQELHTIEKLDEKTNYRDKILSS